jgi:predicted dehydrogenase
MTTNRRQFLLAAAALPGIALGAPTTPRRAAIIGHTGRGDYGHDLERIFVQRPGIQVTAIADPVASGRDRVARALGVSQTYADWRELLERERPELVCIAMRHADQHAEIALGCLRAGAHLFLEKPFTCDPAEADAVLAEAQRRQRRIAVAHTMRRMPIAQRLRQALAEGRIGELREMRAFGKQDARAGGEDLMVLGTHLFDFFRAFAGDPRWCTAQVLHQGRDLQRSDRRLVKDNVGWVAGDQVWAQFAFDHGVHATFTSDASRRETAGHWGMELHGTKGVFRLHGDLAPNVFLRMTGAGDGSQATTWQPLDAELARQAPVHHRDPVDDWLAAIESNREPECSGRNGAWAVEMVAGVYTAALTGQRTAFPLARRTHPLADT